MKLFLMIFSGILFSLAVLYVYQNRDSDRVVAGFLIAVILAVVGFAVKEWITSKDESYKKSFSVVGIFSGEKYQPYPIRFSYTGELTRIIQSIKQENVPKKLVDEPLDLDFANEMYFDAFQILLIQKIFETFRFSWLVEKSSMVLGTYTKGLDEGKDGVRVDLSEVLSGLTDNYFIKNEMVKIEGKTAVLPPDLKIKTIESSKGKYEVVFETKFISVFIRFNQTSPSHSLGEYGKLLGLHSLRSNEGMSTYKISINVVQNQFLNNNPKMKFYRKWADTIVSLLEEEFSYELALKKHKEDFLLYGKESILIYKPE